MSPQSDLEIKKSVVIWTLLLVLLSFGFIAKANGKPQPCEINANYDAAKEALEKFQKQLDAIDGVVQAEVGTCSEFESSFIPKGELRCGIFIWFDSEENQALFVQTSALWNSEIKVSDNKTISICTKRQEQQLFHDGPY